MKSLNSLTCLALLAALALSAHCMIQEPLSEQEEKEENELRAQEANVMEAVVEAIADKDANPDDPDAQSDIDKLLEEAGVDEEEKALLEETNDEDVDDDEDTDKRSLEEVLTESDALEEVLTAEMTDESPLEREKRMVMSNDKRKWDKGIVTYNFNGIPQWKQEAALRAMHAFERFTCFRFYPWEGKQSNTDRGLKHFGHLKFIDKSTCYATVGNTRNAKGQEISCCSGLTCLHELGHALGVYHEQQNPKGRGYVRYNNNAQSGYGNAFKMMNGLFSTGYDIQSVMHYGSRTWSTGGQTLTKLDERIKGPGGGDYYYMMQELSLSHSCGKRYCKKSNLECFNDGYLDLIDGRCQCRCPKGLDPLNGCKTIFVLPKGKKAQKDPFPPGAYALPAIKGGECGAGAWKTGKRVQEAGNVSCKDKKKKRMCNFWKKTGECVKKRNYMKVQCPATCGFCDESAMLSKVYSLAGSRSEHQFCLNNVDKDKGKPKSAKWQAGSYCIYRVGGTCPEGFQDGSISMPDKGPGSTEGDLIDGVFGPKKTVLQFCCRDDGWVGDELVLPAKKPFALFSLSGACQRVKGMHAYLEYKVLPVIGSQISGVIPGKQYMGMPMTSIYHCIYKPAFISCGDVIELSDDNPSAKFIGKSGKADRQCSWLVKAPEDSQILLNFPKFNVSTIIDKKGRRSCKDQVSVRANRLGQSPSVYCGNGFEKSITTVENTLMVTFDQNGEDSGSFIKAEVSLESDVNTCYNRHDRGVTYVGSFNYTRGFKACLPWSQVNCPHSPFNEKDIQGNLESNFCRNPNGDPGPWCYTAQTDCQRDYCDVCQFENRADVKDGCTQADCAKDLKEVLATCAKTCSASLPPVEKAVVAKDVRCGTPPDVPDATVEGHGVGDSYNVGAILNYKCSGGPGKAVRSCLTNGQWSTLNYVCKNSAVCADAASYCGDLVSQNADVCVSKAAFMGKYCKKTCGAC